MRYVTAILAFLIFSAAAYAYTGPTSSAQSQFDCRVIAPLSYTSTANYVLDLTDYEVVAGDTRSFNENVTFTISGEADYDIVVTTSGSWDTAGMVDFKSGSGWGTIPTQIESDGDVDVVFNILGVTADDNAHGVYTYTLNMSVQYDGM